jgi:hypothetical protein
MYTALLALHSLLRWAVLLTGAVAVFRGVAGSGGRRPWTAADARSASWFTISLDIQMVLGLILYVALSPITREAFGDFGAAMRNSALRFWAVEHLIGMIVAIAVAHIGRARIRRLTDDVRRHRTAAIFFGVALVAILLSIPWPGMPNGRVLFRGF